MRADARAMSLKARVRNRAAALGLAPHVILQNYMFERFLVRLAASPWRERLVLKGGLLVAHLHGLAERATMDMDATVRGFALTADSAVAAVAAVCAVDAGDGIAFSVASGEPIRRNDPYGGFRVHFDAAAFGIRAHLSVDLSTGDAVTPAPEEYELPGLFDDTPAIRLLGYSRETILAEKIESILTLSVYGTRPRDYYDLWLLSGDAIRGNILRDALRATCRPPRESSCPRAAKPRHPAAAGVAAPRHAVQGRPTPAPARNETPRPPPPPPRYIRSRFNELACPGDSRIGEFFC